MPAKFKFDALKWTEKAAAKDDNRPCLTWLYADDGALVAADGFRLHVTWGDYHSKADDAGFIEVKKSTLGNEKYSAKSTAEMSFPNWRAIVAGATPRYSVSFTVGQMLQAVKTARIFSKDSNESTTFVFRRDDDGDACYVIGRSAERGDATSRIRATIEHCPDDQPLVIALNASYVIDALAGFPDDANTTLTTAGYNAPVLIGDTDVTPGSHFAVTMQMSIGAQMDAAPDARALADRMALCDATLPAGSDAPISWKDQQRAANKRIGKIVAAAGISYMSEYQQRMKNMAKARREHDKYASIEEIDGGARITAKVEHDAQASTLHDVLSGIRYQCFGSEISKRVGIQVRPDVLRVITLYEDAERPQFAYANILTLRTIGDHTELSAERRYAPGATAALAVKPFCRELPYIVNRALFGKALKNYLPDGAQVVVQSTKPAPAPVRPAISFERAASFDPASAAAD